MPHLHFPHLAKVQISEIVRKCLAFSSLRVIIWMSFCAPQYKNIAYCAILLINTLKHDILLIFSTLSAHYCFSQTVQKWKKQKILFVTCIIPNYTLWNKSVWNLSCFLLLLLSQRCEQLWESLYQQYEQTKKKIFVHIWYIIAPMTKQFNFGQGCLALPRPCWAKWLNDVALFFSPYLIKGDLHNLWYVCKAFTEMDINWHNLD